MNQNILNDIIGDDLDVNKEYNVVIKDKFCKTCETTKKLSEFYKSSRNKTLGIESNCKQCVKAKNTKWRNDKKKDENANRLKMIKIMEDIYDNDKNDDEFNIKFNHEACYLNYLLDTFYYDPESSCLIPRNKSQFDDFMKIKKEYIDDLSIFKLFNNQKDEENIDTKILFFNYLRNFYDKKIAAEEIKIDTFKNDDKKD